MAKVAKEIKPIKQKPPGYYFGRPTGYTDDLPPKLFEAMRQGKSVVQFCSDIDIAKATFYDWVEKHKDFSDAFKAGKSKCESHWETWLQNNFENKNMNSILVKMFFTNRFGWSDKTESKNEVNIKHEETLSDLA